MYSIPLLYNAQAPCILYIPQPSFHLKGVVLWSNLHVEVVSQHRNLLHDVVANLGYLGEEEEGEESSYTSEAAGKGTARICEFVMPIVREGMNILPHDLFGGDAVVVPGDGVSGERR